MPSRRYPKLFIRSKNELSKHICHRGFSQGEALFLINDVLANKDLYWKDIKKNSKPEEGKFNRSAVGTSLGLLLRKINEQILKPHDRMLPNFIFGGISGESHVTAVRNLLGTKRKRSLLRLDIVKFYERVRADRVSYLLSGKCDCSKKIADMISNICCVPLGPKGSDSEIMTIARGFATSPRLAIWCNLDTFIKLDRLVRKKLKGKDPRISIYVDDIGITASRVSEHEMDELYAEIVELFSEDNNQKLPLSDKKKDIKRHDQGMEILGIQLQRNRLELGRKAKAKRLRLKERIKKASSASKRTEAKDRYRAMARYKNYVEKK